ncbi:uncharacterized protein LOC107042427 [Diachasma alloeum]|uniref:uncharacterized protein LOC107042427 n=1 Tax=Diachasma alloeum TaxID=454923 RepID=UPI0007384136|nr:uncharacterized protein LOC107042427 [Diachasma alloeum]
MSIFKIAYGLLLLNLVVGISAVSEKPEVFSTDEYINDETVPVTDEVMDPNIEINDTVDDEDLEGGTDATWDRNRAVRDVAYYLRAHKFLDYDHRYYKINEESFVKLYQDFPKPPLRSLNWEVHQYCMDGFTNCLKYLDTTVQLTSLKRSDDTITIMKQNNWNPVNNSQQILSIQKDCQLAQRRDNLTFIPFQGPIERFQWRTSASYYMCWYTMLESPELGLFGETCDNHANCLDIYGSNNKDPRADDSKPFACAMYSFCPDHCCPMKHIWYMEECFQSDENPCYHVNRPAARKCSLRRESNQDFNALMGNQMNFSCICLIGGYEWSSRFGLCVDVNECTRGLHNCSFKDGQTCVNLPGSFDCLCQFGLVWNSDVRKCEISNIFESILENILNDKNLKSKDNFMTTFVKTLARQSDIITKVKNISKKSSKMNPGREEDFAMVRAGYVTVTENVWCPWEWVERGSAEWVLAQVSQKIAQHYLDAHIRRTGADHFINLNLQPVGYLVVDELVNWHIFLLSDDFFGWWFPNRSNRDERFEDDSDVGSGDEPEDHYNGPRLPPNPQPQAGPDEEYESEGESEEESEREVYEPSQFVEYVILIPWVLIPAAWRAQYPRSYLEQAAARAIMMIHVATELIDLTVNLEPPAILIANEDYYWF